jgi:cytosine/uracil/thiamine/allantoin permease
MHSASNAPDDTDSKDIPLVQRIVAVLWPSFLTAGLATTLFFTVFDPLDLAALTNYPDISRTAAYSIGFFLFWLLTSSTCALTCYFQRPCHRPGNR